MKYYILLAFSVISLLSFGNNSSTSLPMPLPTPPSNDGPCEAITIPVDTSCNTQTFSNVDATNSSVANPSCSMGTIGYDVWFQATIPNNDETFILQLTPQSPTQYGITIYSGADCNNLTEENCTLSEGMGGIGMPVSLTINTLNGQTVWIRVWIENPDPNMNPSGDFDICAYTRDVISVDIDTYTPQELVEEVLITGCLEANNTHFYGPNSAIGYFSNGDVTGFNSGVVIACGAVNDINNTLDAGSSLDYDNPQSSIVNDLLNVANDNLTGEFISSINDMVILEFDFVPSDDTTIFNFVFASEEYHMYECTEYNDAFAFFLSGSGINGPYTDNAINIALVPNTNDAITISSINGSPAVNLGSCTSTHNPQYYIDNIISSDFNVNGYTVPMTAIMAGLTPCETYHIRFVVGDAQDNILTTYVFFEEGSFNSGGEVNMQNTSTVGTNHDVYEGCSNYWVFSRVDTSAIVMLDTIFIDLMLDGTAINGVDYTTSNTNLMILPGEYTDTLFYDGLWDNIQETDEYIIFSLLNGCPCTPSSTTDTIWIFDNFNLDPVITPDTTICLGLSVDLNVTINPLQDESIVEYLWDDGSTGTSISVTPNTTETHTVQVRTPCQQDTTVSMTITVIPPPTATFTISKDSICINEDIDITYIGSAGANTSYTWGFAGGNPTDANTIGPHTVNWSSSGDKIVSLHIDDTGCLNDTSISVFVSPNPSIDITPTNNLCFSDCNGELLATPQDNYTPYTYLWDNGQTSNPATSLCKGEYNVTFKNKFGCVSQDSAQITEPTLLTASTAGIDISCFGNNDGEATVTAQEGTPPYSYSWTGPSSFTGTTANITSLYFGQYDVTVTDANNCTTTSSIYLTQPNIPLTSDITGDDSPCFGEAMGNVYVTPTGGTGPYTYIWSNASTNQNILGVLAGQYDVTLTDNNGCVGYNTYTISEPTALVNDSTTTSPTSCWGYSDGSASVDISGGTPPYTYNWSHNAGTTPDVSALNAGSYNVSVTDANNCFLLVNGINIDEPNKLEVNIPEVPKICIGQNTSLMALATGGTNPYTYIWNNAETINPINVTPVSITSYSVSVTDANNCKASASRTVDVYPAISTTIMANDTNICPGDNVLITLYPDGGNGNYIFTSQTDTVTNPHIIYPENTITYIVTVSDDCGSPTASAAVSIHVLDTPPISFTSDINSGCQPLTVYFNEQSPDIGQTYVWDFGDTDPSNIGTDKHPVHIFKSSGIFDVHLDVFSAEGCKNSLTIENMIEVYKLPEAKFFANPDLVDILNPEVYFENHSTDNFYNYWSFGDGDSSIIESPIHTYANFANEYSISLIVESEHGCLDSVLSHIKVENVITIYVPTAFSPDNDGINDKFYVVGNGIDLDNFNISIYNRWGELIYNSDDIFRAWDGTANGHNVQPGIYKWLLIYKDENGVEYEKSGTVNVIR